MSVISPRLRRVHTQADADRLWSEVDVTGTPLIEDGGRLLTFLWRDDGTTDNVVVVGGPAIWLPIEDDVMTKIVGTDVWFRTYPIEGDLVARYQLSPNDSLEPADDVTDWVAREQTFQRDPLNPTTLHWPSNPADPSTPAHDTSVIAMRDGVITAGEAAQATPFALHRMHSRRLGNERRVWMRASEPADGPARLVVMLDGWVWACALPISTVVDDVERTAGPLVVAMVESLDEETRDLELSCNPDFLGFLTDELVPWSHDTYGTAGRAAIVGQSLGGLAAAHAALTAPETFFVAGAQSGSFWWPRNDADEPQEELTELVGSVEPADVRIYLESGALEGDEMIETAERFRDALRRHGHRVDHRMRYGGHDWLRWHSDLTTLLTTMLE